MTFINCKLILEFVDSWVFKFVDLEFRKKKKKKKKNQTQSYLNYT